MILFLVGCLTGAILLFLFLAAFDGVEWETTYIVERDKKDN